MSKIIQYRTQGTCCALMNVEIDNDIIQNVEFLGGCQGNLTGIKELVKGLNINTVIDKLKGIRCGSKSTSCPDQLANCLIQYKNELSKEIVK